MSKNEILLAETKQLAETQEAVADLTKLAQNAITAYNETHPIFIGITKKLLDMVAEDSTLRNFENSDLLRLLDIANKNQLAPIQELTKLTKELNILHERINASSDVSELRKAVEELQAKTQDNNTYEATVLVKEELVEPEPTPEIVEEVLEEVIEPEQEEVLEEVIEPEPTSPKKVLTIAELLQTKGK